MTVGIAKPTYHEALQIFTAYLKQRFIQSTNVQSMADIDSNMNNGAQARVHKHIDEWID